MIDKQTVNALYYWTKAASMFQGRSPREGGIPYKHVIDKQTVNALYYWTRVAPMLEGDPLEGGSFRGGALTLGFLPKIPFKLTQSIHVALQKNCYFD